MLKKTGADKWYMGAAAFAFLHMAWAPLVVGRIEHMSESKGGKRNVDVQREWFAVNAWRTWTTDVVAWGCALVAVSKTLGSVVE